MTTAWAASTSFSVGDIRRAVTAQTTGLIFKCTTAGISGTSEPSWSKNISGTTQDNTVIWTSISSTYGDLSVINPSSIIELYKLQLYASIHGSNTTYRFHNGANMNSNGEVLWGGEAYQRFPIEASGFEYRGEGTLPRPTLRVSNLLGTLTSIFDTVNETTPYNDLQQARFTRIRTMAKYIDAANFTGGSNPYGTPDSTQELPQEIYLLHQKTLENREFVEWEMVSVFDLSNVKLPGRQFTPDVFPGIGAYV